jgi:coenzyme PQQ biosynthesis protein PqqD
VKPERHIRRPVLSRRARYRWDALRQQHQIVFPEGVLVLNESGAAIVKHCDGRFMDNLLAALSGQFADGFQAADVHAFLGRLLEKGLLRDAADSTT